MRDDRGGGAAPEGLGPPFRRSLTDAARQEQELDLQITLGHALIATKGYAAPEPGEAFARARQLCEQLNRPQQLGRVLVGQLVFRLVRGELEQAEHHAEEMRHLGESRNDAMWKCCRLVASAGLSAFTVASSSTPAPTTRMLSPYGTRCFVPSRRRRRSLRGKPDVSFPDAALPRLCRPGAFAAGRGAGRGATALALQSGLRAMRMLGTGDWAIEGAKSAPDDASVGGRGIGHLERAGLPNVVGVGNIMRGWCLGAMGQAAEGIPLLLQGIAICRAAGANLLLPFFLTTLAEVYGMAAQPEEGLNRLAEAAKLVETTQERWAEAEMHRLRGTLLLSMHEHAAAEDSYRHALAVARRQSAKFWELRAAISLARLWRDQGKRNEARELLAPVYGWFTEGFDTPVLKEAKALLDELA